MLAKKVTLTLAGLALAVGMTAQDSLLLRDYRAAQRADAWLTSVNAAALTRFSQENMATAELSLTRAKGGFTDFYDSPDVVQADASVESYFRLSPQAVVFGAISYDNFSGRDMAGSAFTPHPSPFTLHRPFDIVEDSLMNTGTKHRDVYRLSGGFGIDLWRGMALGARLDYTSANYAKYKDLRHKNKLMDLQLSVGAYVPLGSVVQLGLNYLYHRNTESVLFSTYGKSDRTYNSFINYGPFIGQVEQFGSTGYTDRSREMPLVSDADGLSMQISLQPARCLQFYNAFTYARLRGYYGRRSPYTITYSRHHSNQYRYDARLTARQCGSRFSLDLSLQTENLQNQASTYREQQNDAGASYYEYYTPVKTADRLWTDVDLSLTADLGLRHQLPAWTLQAAFSQAHRKQTAYLYPYYRRQSLRTTTLAASVCRNLVATAGVWSFQLDASFTQGSGAPFEDMTFAEPSDKATEPPTMEAYLWREYQWLTAAQYAVGGSAKYSFLLPAAHLKTYVRADLHHRKCNNPNEYAVGRDRTTATLAIGCEF
ncbi:MAG: hypothetical protein IJ570_08400 [Prevotella sp.]|nr:hypothetical protein [Prevotella sp.]